MTKISIYNKDTDVRGNDKWIGSDAQNQNRTKNFTPDNVAAYFNENQVIDLGVELRYFYDTLDPLQQRVFGSITFETEIGPQVNFSAISTFILSKYTMGHNDVSQFLDFLIGSNVLLSRANNINMFGYYKIDNIEPYLPDPNFFVVTLTFETGNGYMKEDEDYFISLVQFEQTIPDVPTKTSDLINDGEDGVHPFITAEDVTTPTLQSVTDEGDTTTTTVHLDGGALSDSINEQAIFQPDLISTVNLNSGSGASLDSTGKLTLSPDGLVSTLFAADNITQDITLQAPNKTAGSYTLATTDDVPTKTSDLINDGENGVDPFITAADIPPVTGFVPYTGATQDVDLGEFEIKAGQVEFDQTPTGTAGVGVMRWNDSDGTVDLGLKGGNVTLQVGQEQVLRVVNKTATNINLLEANYQAVRVTGAQGQRLKVDLAQAINDTVSAETIGLVTETINNNQEGFITTSGLVRGINTTGSLQGETWADGDILYLSPTTAGNATKVKPVAPNHLIILGYVIRAHITQGSIFVKVDNGYELEELHNVKITSAANNNVLAYTSATDIWENKTVETALGYTPFQLPALTSGSVLFSNGTDIAQDNSQFFWDNTNKRLCLGTNTSVTGSALSISSAAQSNIQLIDTTNNASLNLGVGNFDAIISSNGRLFLQSSTTLSVGTTNVGIGISSATLAKFHVVGNVLFSAGNVSLNSTSGNTQIGTSTDAGFKLDVNGTARVSGELTVNGVNIGLGGGAITTNTRVGLNAGLSNTTGVVNSFFGYSAGRSNTTGGSNSFFGRDAGLNNTTGGNNSFFGVSAGYSNTTGGSNLFLGRNSGRYIADGSTANLISNNSIFLGDTSKALANNQTNQIVIGHNAIGIGSNSVVLGNDSITKTALKGNVLINTTIDGGYRLDVNGTARINTLTIGLGSGQVASNTVLGLNALNANTTGGANTAIGNTAMSANTTGYNNTALGFASLFSNRTGFSNTAIGLQALYANQTASSNTAIGLQSLNGLTSGNGNLSLAASSAQKISSGATLTSATNSIFIGRDTRANANAETNQIVIGDTAIGAGSNTATLGNTSIIDTILRGRINLQQYATGSRPAYVKGALIYDSTLGKLVVGGETGWEVVTSV
jgi:hypothetical protein